MSGKQHPELIRTQEHSPFFATWRVCVCEYIFNELTFYSTLVASRNVTRMQTLVYGVQVMATQKQATSCLYTDAKL